MDEQVVLLHHVHDNKREKSIIMFLLIPPLIFALFLSGVVLISQKEYHAATVTSQPNK